jgi:hypothetical protein
MGKQHYCDHSTEPDPETCLISFTAFVVLKEMCDVLQNYKSRSGGQNVRFISQCHVYQQLLIAVSNEIGYVFVGIKKYLKIW